MAIVVGSVLLVAIALWAYRVANRLDRLHVRTDLARQALVATLDRRAVVARAIATALRAREEEDLDALGVQLAVDADRAVSRNPLRSVKPPRTRMSLVLSRVSAATKGTSFRRRRS